MRVKSGPCQRTQARKEYAFFVEAWQDADPEPRPWVEDARRALARLSPDRLTGLLPDHPRFQALLEKAPQWSADSPRAHPVIRHGATRHRSSVSVSVRFRDSGSQ